MGCFELFKNGVVADIIVEHECPEGVKRIAKVVADDIEMVTGIRPRLFIAGDADFSEATLTENVILVEAEPDAMVKGKREVYKLEMDDGNSEDNLFHTFLGVSKILYVTGSDRLGLIYGLFAISEMCGVSPLVWWGDVRPEKREFINININSRAGDILVSREPSIKYRGFFINDEWPAFGRWCNEKFGGFTVSAYEQVFILLLRMRGNYMWPAMWSSIFSEDGPGHANAELADMYGITMGTSHHEPLCRAGEEWQKIYRNYGDDNTWSFISNKEAITDFWRDGLARNRDFANIYTIGMRGECDSKLLGEDATLADNINVIKDAILTQHRLLRENVECDLTRVPRMLAIYKEVEDYYYGDKDTEGLRDWDELNDVIFLLCEDNFGNMRGLPEEADRLKHTGGYGMYYHFDYHGAPISYEWVNCNRLTKTREQMCMAYEYGVRNLWIVNVGDLKGNEYPLSYFMALAYNYERWSMDDAVEEYVSEFINRSFGNRITLRQECEMTSFIDGFTKWNSIRHPEAMNPEIFNPFDFDEAGIVHTEVQEIMSLGKSLRRSLNAEVRDAFDSMFYYAGMASLNLILMHIEAALNKFYAKRLDEKANGYAESVRARIEMDAEYVNDFHKSFDGKWNHMMDSKHTGFVTWNDEGAHYPEAQILLPTEIKQQPSDGGCMPLTPYELRVITIEADNFNNNRLIQGEGWRVIQHLGRLGNAIKAYPITKTFTEEQELPYVQYDMGVEKGGAYTLEFVFMARNPVVKGAPMRAKYSVNHGDMCTLEILGKDYFTEWRCKTWNEGVMTGIHTVETVAAFVPGKNFIRVYPCDPNVILERIVIYPSEVHLPKTYLGAR